MQTICTECRKINADGAKRCRYCGHYFKFIDALKYNLRNTFFIGLLSGAAILLAGQAIERFDSTKRESKAEQLEHKRLTFLLQTEFDKNYFALAHNHEWIRKNRGALEKEERDKGSLQKADVVIIDLKPLKFLAWEYAQLNSNFLEKINRNDRTRLVAFYSSLETIDTMIRNREAFRLSSKGKDWMALTIKNLDNNIEILIKEIEAIVFQVGDQLFGSDDWRNERRRLIW